MGLGLGTDFLSAVGELTTLLAFLLRLPGLLRLSGLSAGGAAVAGCVAGLGAGAALASDAALGAVDSAVVAVGLDAGAVTLAGVGGTAVGVRSRHSPPASPSIPTAGSSSSSARRRQLLGTACDCPAAVPVSPMLGGWAAASAAAVATGSD